MLFGLYSTTAYKYMSHFEYGLILLKNGQISYLKVARFFQNWCFLNKSIMLNKAHSLTHSPLADSLLKINFFAKFQALPFIFTYIAGQTFWSESLGESNGQIFFVWKSESVRGRVDFHRLAFSKKNIIWPLDSPSDSDQKV